MPRLLLLQPVPVRTVVTLMVDLRTQPLWHYPFGTAQPLDVLILTCNDSFTTTHAPSSMG